MIFSDEHVNHENQVQSCPIPHSLYLAGNNNAYRNLRTICDVVENRRFSKAVRSHFAPIRRSHHLRILKNKYSNCWKRYLPACEKDIRSASCFYQGLKEMLYP